jgi:hypothetical protein
MDAWVAMARVRRRCAHAPIRSYGCDSLAVADVLTRMARGVPAASTSSNLSGTAEPERERWLL